MRERNDWKSPANFYDKHYKKITLGGDVLNSSICGILGIIAASAALASTPAHAQKAY
jgi:hypothetical protein